MMSNDDILDALIWARSWAVDADYCLVCGTSQNEDCPTNEWCGAAYEALQVDNE